MSSTNTAARERYDWDLREIDEWQRGERSKCVGTPEIGAKLADLRQQLADLEAQSADLGRRVHGLRVAKSLVEQERDEACADEYESINMEAKRRRRKALEAYEEASRRRPARLPREVEE